MAKKKIKHLKNHNPDAMILSTGEMQFQPIATPHRCPICYGQGLVPNGFYLAVGVNSYPTSSATPETCRSCSGTGIVWHIPATHSVEFKIHE